MRLHAKPMVSFAVLIVLLLAPPHLAQAQRGQVLLQEIVQTYLAVAEAYGKGANTTALTARLNRIVDAVLNRKNTTDTYTITSQLAVIREEAERLGEEAQKARLWGNALLAAAIAATLLAIAGAYRYLFAGRKIWAAWLRIRRDNRVVVRKKKAKRHSMLLDEEVQAVLAAIIVVVVVFAAAQYLTAGRVVEPFSELGILGEKMKIGDYPTSLVEGEEAKVYIYVGNHMGRPMLYQIRAMLGNRTTPVDPAPLQPFWTHYLVLEHNQTATIPLHFSINQTGTYRLIVELWAYNQTAGAIQYHKRWVQLWINVTPLIRP